MRFQHTAAGALASTRDLFPLAPVSSHSEAPNITKLPKVVAACCDNDVDPVQTTPSGNSLVQDLIDDNTTDSAEPIEIDDLDLQFSEDENCLFGTTRLMCDSALGRRAPARHPPCEIPS